MVRWGTMWEVAVDILANFPAFWSVIFNTPDLDSQLTDYLVDALQELKLNKTMIELAYFADCGRIIYNFLYFTESDEFITHQLYEKYRQTEAKLTSILDYKVSHAPTVEEVEADYKITILEKKNLLKNQLSVVKAKWDLLFHEKYCESIDLLYHFSILDPATIRLKSHSECTRIIESQPSFPVFRQYAVPIQALKSELKYYLQLVSSTNADIDAMSFWKKMKIQLPNYYNLFTIAVSFLVSSASAERGHAVLRDRFEGGKEHALDDYKETSVMCRVNTVKRSNPI